MVETSTRVPRITGLPWQTLGVIWMRGFIREMMPPAATDSMHDFKPSRSQPEEIPDQADAGVLAFFRVELTGEHVAFFHGGGECLAAVGGFRNNQVLIQRCGKI